MRKQYRTLIAALTAWAFLSTAALGQADMSNQWMRDRQPFFTMDAVTLLGESGGQSRILAYLDITYEDLQFVRSGRGYEANYQIDLSVLAGTDENAPRVVNKLWKETVVVNSFEKTNDRHAISVAQTSFELPAGTYLLIATVTDMESKRHATMREVMKVPAYGLGGIEVSDLIVAKDIQLMPDGIIEVVPNVERVISDQREPIYIYYEAYPYQADSLHVYARLLDSRGEIVRELHLVREAIQPITRDFLKIPLTDLPVGRYVFEMQISSGDKTALKGTNFRIQMSGLPGAVPDLPTAIRQLRYIAKSSTIKRIQNAPPKEQEQMFKDFWTQRDPSPDTEENELLQEYYYRIDRANTLFGSFRDGWETDRGEVFIRFGPPDEVERHPYEFDTRPYEIWYYYDTQRRFIFVDEMGYGEYRLVSDLWQ